MTTKEELDKAYKALERDIAKAVEKLSKQKSRENFGDTEIRAIKDKYSNYLSGNYTTYGRFMERVKSFENWCYNYVNW